MAEPDEVEIEKEELLDYAMKGQWKEVVEAYRESPRMALNLMKITKSGDTALHLAVKEGETTIALQLIDAIVNEDSLGIRNATGDTPLHLAAALDDLAVCQRIFAKSQKIVTIRNNKGETPVFFAALHGKKKAFLLLHSFNQDEQLLRRENGDTILHITIANNNFSK